MNDPGVERAIERARQGDGGAFDALVRHIEKPLLGFVRARGADDPHAAASEVLVRVFHTLESFEGNAAQFRAWVFTIARNLVIDEHRQTARRTRTVPTDPHEMPDTAVPSGDVSDTERVNALLADLTDEQREVVLLRIVAGLGVDEVAAALGKRPGAVRALQHRALGQLRKKLSGDP